MFPGRPLVVIDYEYKAHVIQGVDSLADTSKLNDLFNEGWELCDKADIGRRNLLVFLRRRKK